MDKMAQKQHHKNTQIIWQSEPWQNLPSWTEDEIDEMEGFVICEACGDYVHPIEVERNAGICDHCTRREL